MVIIANTNWNKVEKMIEKNCSPVEDSTGEYFLANNPFLIPAFKGGDNTYSDEVRIEYGDQIYFETPGDATSWSKIKIVRG